MSNASMAAGVLGILLGAGALALVLGRDAGEGTAALETRVASLGTELDEANDRVADLERKLTDLQRDVTGVADQTRIAMKVATEARDRPAVSPADGPTGTAPEEAPAAGEETGPDGEPGELDLDAFEALMASVWSDDASADDQARFWEAARNTDLLDQLVARREAVVKENPRDVEARMDLASAFVGKIIAAPPGPEQGAWAMKAEGQWYAVLEQEPEHWQATYNLGESWSWYPEQLGKGPDAIKKFEKAREIQESGTPEKKHEGTYERLSMLHRRQGNTDQARKVLEDGLRRHPDSETLKKALDAMGPASDGSE